MSACRLRDVQAFLLDMDGTLYRGERLFEGTREFMEALRRRGKRYLLLTNNSSQSIREYGRKLAGMNIPVESDDVFTSTLATILHLKRRGGKRRLFVLATPAVEQEFTEAGFVLTDGRPDYVVLCFDKTLTYAKLETACRLILQGAAFVATHPDLVCPTEGLPIPDCGAMIRMISAATGVEPEIVGKPNRTMLDSALEKLGAAAETTAMVGDRLYTDMEMGFLGELTTVLVLSGETTRDDLAAVQRRPDYIVDSVAELVDQV